MKNNLKLSYITPRPKPYKQDPIKQDEFKEEINENIKKNDYDLVLFMDESRFGTHSNTGHGWFPCGKRTTVEISIGDENFYVYSAVSSTNGYNFNLIMPNVDSECMSSFLKELSLDNTGKKILLIADGASWHDSKTLEIPENIYIAKLPPYSPELNPTERYFQYMKEQIIKNKLWTTISELKNNTMSFLKDITNEQVASISACNYIIT